MITPLPHQVEKANEAVKILKELGYVYINGQPRSGKTFTSILIAEQCEKVKSVMVLTKKQAIDGWLKFITPDLRCKYTVINYEQLGTYNAQRKIVNLKHNPSEYQLVIIDESHNIGAYPKPSGRWRVVKSFCMHLPHIHLSGTPVIESANHIYHQMAISIYNPFKFASFYRFFDKYGIPSTTDVRGMKMPCYDLFKPELLDELPKFTVYMSQQDAGINIQVEDKIHYITLNEQTKKLYNEVLKKRVALNGDLVCDSVMKLRTSLHMIEGGTVKVDDDYIDLEGSNEKIRYIKEHFGDNEHIGIMSHFIGERKKLEKHFKRAKIFSSNAHAEGVDLSHLKHFIIYSSDYSGAKFVQRRERIANVNGSNTNIVHHLLVKGAISDEVYKAVSSKRDFNNQTFIDSGIGELDEQEEV